MTDRRARRAVQRLNQRFDPMVAGLYRGRARAQAAWFKPPAPTPRELTAARVAKLHDVPPRLLAGPPSANAQVGSYGWAKNAAKAAADMELALQQTSEVFSKDTEHWADALLRCPTSSLNHRTARFCGKPYHWRQDYTGQLKLAAGESPW